ncbi:MAG: hypothetical protein WCY19_05835 [Candidatus Gastranaerophilaceae bacterium]
MKIQPITNDYKPSFSSAKIKTVDAGLLLKSYYKTGSNAWGRFLRHSINNIVEDSNWLDPKLKGIIAKEKGYIYSLSPGDLKKYNEIDSEAVSQALKVYRFGRYSTDFSDWKDKFNQLGGSRFLEERLGNSKFLNKKELLSLLKEVSDNPSKFEEILEKFTHS